MKKASLNIIFITVTTFCLAQTTTATKDASGKWDATSTKTIQIGDKTCSSFGGASNIDTKSEAKTAAESNRSIAEKDAIRDGKSSFDVKNGQGKAACGKAGN